MPANGCSHVMKLLQKGGLTTLGVQNECVEILIVFGQIKHVDELINPGIRHIIGSPIDYRLVPNGCSQRSKGTKTVQTQTKIMHGHEGRTIPRIC